MATTAPAQRFAAMDSWLTRLEREVRILRKNEFVFWEMQRMIQRNRQLQVPSEFHSWLGRIYGGGMSIGVRRQIESDTRTQSLVRFLNRLKGDPSIISRKHYESLYPVAARAMANRTYDRFVGRGRAQLLPYQIERQIQTLYRRSSDLVEFANREAAQMGAARPTNVPTFGQPGHVIRYLEKLIQFYVQLFRGTHVSMDLNFVYDWKAPFRVAWLP